MCSSDLKSSKKKVVTVNSKGEIKAVKAGEAKITVTAADGTGKSASCKVTVKRKKVVTPPANPDIAVGSVALNSLHGNHTGPGFALLFLPFFQTFIRYWNLFILYTKKI